MQIHEVFNHKLARLIMSKNEGVIEKQFNDLKQNAEFRAKVTLAINKVVSDFTMR